MRTVENFEISKTQNSVYFFINFVKLKIKMQKFKTIFGGFVKNIKKILITIFH